MHKVAVLALKNVVQLDLIIPIEVFSRARTQSGKPCYKVSVCGPSKSVKGSLLSFGLNPSFGLSNADTIVIPGTEPIGSSLPIQIREQLIKAHRRGARLISICSGAFHLAETGLLDGRSATTHWVGTDELKSRFPKIKVNPNVLYVDEGDLMTSAGACAGFDLCLHIVRKDFGAAVAASSARLAVMPLERSGGQAQHIDHAPPSRHDGSLCETLEWIEENLEKELSLGQIAANACMSVRTLNRQFKSQTGTSPLKWVLNARIKRARVLLETTQDSVDRIAMKVGFGSPTTMREHFKKQVLTNPKSYRESFIRTTSSTPPSSRGKCDSLRPSARPHKKF